MEKKNLQTITEELAEKSAVVKSIKSITFNAEKNRIEIECVRYYCKKYDGQITSNQLEFMRHKCDYQSISNMGKLNKWCASVAISAIKDYALEPSELYIAC